MKSPEEQSPFDLCECGHTRAMHIYHVGACRPGFVCPASCAEFTEKVDWKAKYERLRGAALTYASGDDSPSVLDELLDAAGVPHEGTPL